MSSAKWRLLRLGLNVLTPSRINSFRWYFQDRFGHDIRDNWYTVGVFSSVASAAGMNYFSF